MIAESSGDTTVEENSGPYYGPLWVAPDLGDKVRLLADLSPDGQRQALVSLMRHAAGGSSAHFFGAEFEVR